MKILIQRKPTTPTYTEGEMFINGEWWAMTLEDTVRKGKKVYGQTAIPAGKYRVVVDYSEKFRKKMTHILSVPGFEGIRLHQGCHPRDSYGCPLLSKRRGGTPGTLTAMKAGILTDELTRLVEQAGGAEIEIRNG